MNILALVNSGLEQLVQEEVKTILKSSSVSTNNIVEFSTANLDRLIHFVYHSQSSRRIVLKIARTTEINTMHLPEDFPWLDFFPTSCSFKIEVESVKGQENRIAIAKNLASKICTNLKEKGIDPRLELKRPDFLIIVFFNGKEYVLGIDLAGKELNDRSYRVFAHQASFKGDFAYYFVRRSRFEQGKKLLVGFCKDGTIAIEAALLANNLPVQKNQELDFQKCPLFFQELNKTLRLEQKAIKTVITAFDQTLPNITASRKNAKLAGVSEVVEIQKYSLDDLDVKFAPEEFDHLIFHITQKDEDAINEVYYQSSYILKQGGTLLLITRKNWVLPLSDKFQLLLEEELQRGESVHKIWLLEKK